MTTSLDIKCRHRRHFIIKALLTIILITVTMIVVGVIALNAEKNTIISQLVSVPINIVHESKAHNEVYHSSMLFPLIRHKFDS